MVGSRVVPAVVPPDVPPVPPPVIPPHLLFGFKGMGAAIDLLAVRHTVAIGIRIVRIRAEGCLLVVGQTVRVRDRRGVDNLVLEHRSFPSSTPAISPDRSAQLKRPSERTE